MEKTELKIGMTYQMLQVNIPADQVLDSDNDGLFNLEEEEYGTDPTKADSDGIC